MSLIRLFIPRFVKGYLNYYLAYYPFHEDLDYDIRTENLTWYEQVLNLTPSQVNALFDCLVDNARPEKRYYRYDFILDNCATRIRDAMLKVLGPAVRFLAPQYKEAPHKTYRQIINEFVSDRPFYRFVFYPVLGMASDKEATSFESQFLSGLHDESFRGVDNSQGWKKEEPLVVSTNYLYKPGVAIARGTAWAGTLSSLFGPQLPPLCFLQSAISSYERKKGTAPIPPQDIPLFWTHCCSSLSGFSASSSTEFLFAACRGQGEPQLALASSD